MRKLLGSLAIVVALLAVSCGGEAATPTAPPTQPPAPTATAPPTATVPPAATAPATASAAAVTPTRAAPTATPSLPTPTATTAKPAPKSGGILTRGTTTEATTLDFDHPSALPLVFLLLPIYNTLIRLQPTEHQQVVASLAERWQVDPSGTEYTFSLRKNVTWQDGTPFTADDVVFSISRVLSPPAGVTIGGFNSTMLSAVRSASKVDASTVKITLNFPQANLLERLAFPQLAMVSKNVIGPLDAAQQPITEKQMIGTGPFLYKSHDASISWDLVRNPKYWDTDAGGRQLPYLDGVRSFIIVDDAAAFAALRTKQILQSKNADRGIRPEFVPFAKQQLADKMNLFFIISDAWQGFSAINHSKFPWSDARFRQAVSLALNRQALIDFNGGTELNAIGTMVHPLKEWALPPSELANLPGYRADKTADIAKAKDLLNAMGVKSGFDLTVMTTSGASAQAASAMVDNLRQIGLNVKLDIVSTGVAPGRELAKDFDAVYRARVEPLPDPSVMVTPYAATNGAQNWGKYSNPEIDRLLEQEDRELDTKKRKDLVNALERRLLLEDLPVIKTFYFHYVNGIWKEVHDLVPGPGLWNGFADYDVAWIG